MRIEFINEVIVTEIEYANLFLERFVILTSIRCTIRYLQKELDFYNIGSKMHC